MSHPELVESANRLEIRSPMRAGMRVLLAALALFPLLAPYELLIRVEWQQYMHPAFFLVAFISVGAMALSALLLFAAIAGLSSQMVFDKGSATFTYSAKAPVIRRKGQTHPLSEVCGVEVGVRDWSDSAPTYHLGVSVTDGTVFESGSSWSRDEIELIRARVQQFLADGGPSRAAF
jgi:hypothetical protein